MLRRHSIFGQKLPSLAKYVPRRRKILRALDPKEASTLTRQIDETYVHLVRISTRQIDLFQAANLHKLKNSIRLLQQAHPFLNTRICVQPGDEPSNKKFYFDLIEQPTSGQNLDHVKFLKLIDHRSPSLARHSIDFFDHVSNLLLDSFEFKSPLSHLKDKLLINPSINGGGYSDRLWQLVVFKLDTPYTYDVMLYIHHSIIQARSSYRLVMQMFQMFEDLSLGDDGGELSVKPYEPYVGTDVVFKHVRRLPPPDHVPLIRSPRFLRTPPKSAIDRPPQSMMNFSSSDDETKNLEIIDIETRRSFASLDWLETISQQSTLKQRRFNLDPDLTSRLLKKCKLERVKLSMCLQMVVSLSLAELYQKQSTGLDDDANEKLNEIVYYTAICLRKHAGLSEDQMGYCTGALLSVLSSSQVSELGANFWPISRTESDKFGSRLEHDERKYFLQLKTVNKSEWEVNMHFLMSNMMSLENTATTRCGLVRARQAYWFSNANEHVIANRIFSNTVCLLDGRLQWLVQFDSRLLAPHFVQHLIDTISANISAILTR